MFPDEIFERDICHDLMVPLGAGRALFKVGHGRGRIRAPPVYRDNLSEAQPKRCLHDARSAGRRHLPETGIDLPALGIESRRPIDSVVLQ